MNKFMAVWGLVGGALLAGCFSLSSPERIMTAAQAQAADNDGYIEFDLSGMAIKPGLSFIGSIDYFGEKRGHSAPWLMISITDLHREGDKVVFNIPKLANYKLSQVGLWPTALDGKSLGEARVVLVDPNNTSWSTPMPKLSKNNEPLEISAMGRDEAAPGITATVHLKDGRWSFYGVFLPLRSGSRTY